MIDLSKFKKNILFKEGDLINHLPLIHPYLLMIMGDMACWCGKRGIPFMLTRIIDEKMPNSISTTHEEGRAFDLSHFPFSTENRSEFENHFNKKYENYGAISLKTNQSTTVKYHDCGYGFHLHIQIRKIIFDIGL